jgi:hypothetical protein
MTASFKEGVMRRRLYFVLPDVKHARDVFDQLLLHRIEDSHVHFLARENTDLGDLPKAEMLQTTDAVHGWGLGLTLGGLTGAVAGVVMLMFPPQGFGMGLGIVLVMSLLGALMGAWASGMIASSVPNTQLEQFDKEIERGKILLMVDIPKDRVEEITRLLEQHEAIMRGSDPTIPAFP